MEDTNTAGANRLITVDELASYLQLHPVSVRRMTLRGDIPAIHIGRTVRYDLTEVLDTVRGTRRDHAEN